MTEFALGMTGAVPPTVTSPVPDGDRDRSFRYGDNRAFNALYRSWSTGSKTSAKSPFRRSQSKLEIRGSTLSFENVCYTVKVGSMFKKTDQVILDHNSGIFEYGHMNAIMGPSGSGKSSLLDLLAGRKDPQFMTGQVLVDGHEQPKDFRLMSGYVTQDDEIMGTLTVRENLIFSAALRLPKNTTQEARDELVQRIIDELQLNKCSETRIGDAFTRGVSGGERKRTAIGMELIITPKVLFLDEPTTGLDSNTGFAVMSLLQRLARKGSTIVFSIHQPRYSIFKLFDKIMLLGNGQTMYTGMPMGGIEYFKDLGYVCDPRSNPTDFYLDVINGDIAQTSKYDEGDDCFTAMTNADDEIWNDEGPSKGRTLWLASKFKGSHTDIALQNQLREIFTEGGKPASAALKVLAPGYPTSMWEQIKILSVRSMKNYIRNPQTFAMQNGMALVMAIICGIVFYQLAPDCSGLQNRYGALFFVTQSQIFGNMAAKDLFIQARSLYIHERISGFYRVSSYFLSKCFCDILPMRIFPTIIFCLIAYFLMGLQIDAGKFFFFVLTILIGSLSFLAAIFLVSSSVQEGPLANIIVSVYSILTVLFAGYIVNVESIDAWLSWLKYLSISRYCLMALTINEVAGQTYYPIPQTSPNDTCPTDSASGDTFLEQQGIPYEDVFDMWVPVLALLGFMAGYFILTYIQLRRMKIYK